MATTVAVDKGLCQGHGMCWMVAGELFQSDDEGYSEPTSTEVPPDLVKKAHDAERMCPEYAITVTEG